MRIRAIFIAIALISSYASFEISGSFFRSHALDETHRDIVLLIDKRRGALAAATELAESYRVSASEVADTVEVFERLLGEAPSPLPLLAITGQALGPGIVIRQADWLIGEEAGARDVRLVLTTHHDTWDGSQPLAVVVADALSDRMATMLPSFDVRVSDPAVITISLPDSSATEPPEPPDPST